MASIYNDFSFVDHLYTYFKSKVAILGNMHLQYRDFVYGLKEVLDANFYTIHLRTIEQQMPIVLVWSMVAKMQDEQSTRCSKYALYRACEDYVVKTEWFCELPARTKFRIRQDFYSTIILGVNAALIELKQLKYNAI